MEFIFKKGEVVYLYFRFAGFSHFNNTPELYLPDFPVCRYHEPEAIINGSSCPALHSSGSIGKLFACFWWRKQLLDVGWNLRASSCFVVNNPQGTFFCIHTVDCATQTESERSLSCLYSYLFWNFLFHSDHFERSILKVVTQQLFQIGNNYFGVAKLCRSSLQGRIIQGRSRRKARI